MEQTAQIARLEVLVQHLTTELTEMRTEMREGIKASHDEIAEMKNQLRLGKGFVIGCIFVVGALLVGIKEAFIKLWGGL